MSETISSTPPFGSKGVVARVRKGVLLRGCVCVVVVVVVRSCSFPMQSCGSPVVVVRLSWYCARVRVNYFPMGFFSFFLPLLVIEKQRLLQIDGAATSPERDLCRI